MSRTTIADVRERVDALNGSTDVPLTFQAWGSGQNTYRLMNEETGEVYGKPCVGASEFMSLLSGFDARGRIE